MNSFAPDGAVLGLLVALVVLVWAVVAVSGQIAAAALLSAVGYAVGARQRTATIARG